MCKMCDDQIHNDTSEVPCDHCAGRGFQLDWDDHGGQMRAVPGDTCRVCAGTGNFSAQDASNE
jgi:DnaJ-class molecular chaperone